MRQYEVLAFQATQTKLKRYALVEEASLKWLPSAAIQDRQAAEWRCPEGLWGGALPGGAQGF